MRIMILALVATFAIGMGVKTFLQSTESSTASSTASENVRFD